MTMSNISQTLLDLVLKADKALFTDHDLTALEKYFATDFVEHSPLVKDAIPGLKELIINAGNKLKHDVVRAWIDEKNKLVALHGCYTGLADEVYVGFDIYRLENNKIIEHWDGLVSQQAANASGRTQLDGTTEVKDTHLTEQNRQLVIEFFTDVLINGHYQNISLYTNGARFKQHSPDIADGAEPMQQFLEQLKIAGTPLIYHKLHRTVAQGQFVLTHSEGEFQGKRTSYCELWRIEGGKVVELWDAISSVPSDDEALHHYGIF